MRRMLRDYSFGPLGEILEHEFADRVQEHFDNDAQRLDAIYVERKPLHQRIVDRLFRQVVLERFRLVCNLAPARSPAERARYRLRSGRCGIGLARQTQPLRRSESPVSSMAFRRSLAAANLNALSRTLR